MEIITFTKVKLPFGWLSNMSPHKIRHKNRVWASAEALFQAMRFGGSHLDIQDEVWRQTSPMAAKLVAKKHADKFQIVRGSPEDLNLMRLVLQLKVDQHSDLRGQLISTGNAEIIEDVTKRPNESGLFWGAALVDGTWKGENNLGRLWMGVRKALHGKGPSFLFHGD